MLREGESQLLDHFLPHYHFSESHGLVVNASPATVFAAVMACDLTQSPLVRWLFRLRSLPRREITISNLDKIGFRFLGVDQNREVVMGLVGRFWTPSGGILHIRAEEFLDFNADGYAKTTANFRLQPLTNGRVRLTTETRIWCTSPESRVLFGIYWAFIRPFSGLIRREWLRLVKRGAERRIRSD
jgi:hypothetical protein